MKASELKLEDLSRVNESQLADLRSQIKQKEDEILQKENEIEKLKAELAEKQQENVQVCREHDTKIKEMNECAEARFTEYEKIITHLQCEVKEAENNSKVVEKQLMELQMTLLKKEHDYQKTIMNHEKEKLELRLQISQMETREEALKTELEKAKRMSAERLTDLEVTKRMTVEAEYRKIEEENRSLLKQVSDSAVPTSGQNPKPIDGNMRSGSDPLPARD